MAKNRYPVIGIDTNFEVINFEVITGSLTTWESHHSPRSRPEDWWVSHIVNEPTMTEIGLSILFYYDENKLSIFINSISPREQLSLNQA